MPDLINSCIVYFKDLVDEHGEIWGYEFLVVTYSLKIIFLDFYALKKSIPRDWITTTGNRGCNHSNFSRIVDVLVNRILLTKNHVTMYMTNLCMIQKE